MRVRHLFWIGLVASGLLVVGMKEVSVGDAEDGVETDSPSYTSHYVVFGTQDATEAPRILAVDFNRTAQGPDRVAYEYKLFVSRGHDWSMPVYETWTVDPNESERFPSRAGLAPTIKEDGRIEIRVNRSDHTLHLRTAPSSFPFPSEASSSPAGTSHPHVTVEWNGTTYEGPGVYEWIRSSPSSASADEDNDRAMDRRLDEEATFGLYDWIVLYDDEGRLWHVSQGTLSDDFAYQHAADRLPAETDNVLVRWLATAYDEHAQQHSPTAWLVDVPAWDMRVRLKKKGEHRGHGDPRADGTRPIYVQASAEGRGLIRGEEHQFFGMVEHIRD